MDEKYIQELYSGLGGTEVLGDYNDFYELITNDDTYIQDIHSNFGEETLGDYNDFYDLVKKKDEAGVSPIEKEGEVITSDSEEGKEEAGPAVVSVLTEDKDVVKTEEVTEEKPATPQYKEEKADLPKQRKGEVYIDEKSGETSETPFYEGQDPSTHLMRAEQLEDGSWVGFPSLFQNEDGTWTNMSNEANWEKVYNEAKRRGEVYDFGKDKEKALAFGEGSWKKDVSSLRSRWENTMKSIRDLYTVEKEKIMSAEPETIEELGEKQGWDKWGDEDLSGEHIKSAKDIPLDGVVGAFLLGQQDDDVVPILQKMYGVYGFDFEKTVSPTDQVLVRPKKEGAKPQWFNLDQMFDFQDKKEAEKLRAFLKENASDPIRGDITKVLEAAKAKDREAFAQIYDQTLIDDEKAAVLSQVEQLRIDQGTIEQINKNFAEQNADIEIRFEEAKKNGHIPPELKRDVEKLLKDEEEVIRLNKQYNADRKGTISRQEEIEALMGAQFELKASQGGPIGNTWNAFLNGFGWIAGGATDIGIDLAVEAANAVGLVEGDADKLKKEYKKELPAIRKSFVHVLGSDATPESLEKAKQDFWGGAWYGLVESVPAMLGASAVTPARIAMLAGSTSGLGKTIHSFAKAVPGASVFGLQVIDFLNQEMEKNPEFKEISERERWLVKAPTAIVVGVLENFGLRNVLKGKAGVIGKLVDRVLKRAPKGATFEVLEDIAIKEVKRDLLKGILKRGVAGTIAAGAAEFETGFTQQVAEIGIKDIYNTAKGKELFKDVDFFSMKMLEDAVVAGAQEAIGGKIVHGLMAVPAGYSEHNLGAKATDQQFELLEQVITNPEFRNILTTSFKNQIIAGNITHADAAKQKREIELAAATLSSLDPAMPTQKKRQIFDLLNEKKQLEEKIKPLAEETTEEERNRISEIDETIKKVISEPVVKEEAPVAEEVVEEEEKKPERGRKQIDRHISTLKEATTPEEKLNTINKLKRNMSEGAVATKEELELINKIEEELKKEGYEIVDLEGREYNEGMKLEPDFEIDENLEEGVGIIDKVLSPQIMKDGKVVQPAKVIVRIGSKKDAKLKELEDAETKAYQGKDLEAKKKASKELRDYKKKIVERAQKKAVKKAPAEAVVEEVKEEVVTEEIKPDDYEVHLAGVYNPYQGFIEGAYVDAGVVIGDTRYMDVEAKAKLDDTEIIDDNVVIQEQVRKDKGGTPKKVFTLYDKSTKDKDARPSVHTVSMVFEETSPQTIESVKEQLISLNEKIKEKRDKDKKFEWSEDLPGVIKDFKAEAQKKAVKKAPAKAVVGKVKEEIKPKKKRLSKAEKKAEQIKKQAKERQEKKEEVKEEVVEEVAEDAGEVAAEYRKAKEDFLKDNPDTPQSVIDVMDNMIKSAEELDAKTKEAPIEEQAEPYEQWLDGYKERTGQFLKDNPDLGQGAKDAISNMMAQAEALQEKASKERVFGEIENRIVPEIKKRQPNLDAKTLKEVQSKKAIAYLQGTKWYEQATDTQRDAAVREVKKMLKMPAKAAPSISKLFKIAADKVIEVTDKQLRKWMLKDLETGKKAGVREAKAQQREAAKIKKALKDELSKELNAILKEGKGKLTIPQVRAILNKFDKMNILNETKREAFIDYTKKVLKKAEYVEQISKANKQRKRALKNIKRKIGTAQNLFPLLKKLFAINPTLIPLSQLDKYFDIVNEFGSSARVLNLKEKGKTSKDANNILNKIEEEVEVVEPEVKEKTKDIIDLINKPFLTEEDKKAIREKAEDFTESTLNKFDRATLEELAIILEDTPTRKMVDEYITERDRLTQDILDDKANIDNLDLQDEKNTADRINDLTKEDLNDLDGDTLNNIMKIKDNIENGFLPHAAIQILTEVDSNTAATQILPAVKKIDEKKYLRFFSTLYGNIKTAISGGKTTSTLKQMESNPITVIDQIFGNLKNKNIFNNTFGKLAKKWSSYESQQAAMDEKYDTAENLISSQFISNPNKVVKSRYKIMAYLLQQEYQANEGNATVAPALDFINETIKAADNLRMNIVNDHDARILKEIKDEFTVDGKIDAKKIKDSLSKKEKKALEIIEEANASLGPKALYTSSVIRGNRVDMLNNYVHHQVISQEETKDFLNQQEQFVNPSTKAGNLLARTEGAKPINFDPISSGRRASRMTLLDYNMTEVIKTVRKTVKKVKDTIDSDPKSSKLQKEGAASLEMGVENILKLVFENQFSSLTGWDKVLTKVKNIGYYAALASVPRAAAELSSNYLYGMLSSPKELSKGLTTYMKVSISNDSVNILQNVESAETNKLYGAEKLAGKYADSGYFSRGKDVGSSAVNDVKNMIAFVHNNSTKRLSQLTSTIAGALISTPDKALSRPLWFGTFATKFQEVSGQKVDFDKIRDNDAQYMKENKEAIDAATLSADEASVRASTTTNPFESIMKNVARNEGSGKKMLRAVNSYMARFSLYEYTTARTAIYSMMGVGELSPVKGAALMLGVTARMSAYVVLYNVFRNAFQSLFGVEEEDDEDIEDLISRQIVGSAVSLFTRRTLGNIPMMPINLLIEKGNEKFLQDLRDGKLYDAFKHSIVFSQISPEDFGKYGFEELMLRNFAGPLSPAVRSAARAYAVIVRSQTAKKPETRQKYIDEMTGRMAIEAAGNLNLLPFYKDIRSIIVKDMFKDSDKKEEGQSKAKAKAKATAKPTAKAKAAEAKAKAKATAK